MSVSELLSLVDAHYVSTFTVDRVVPVGSHA